MANCKKCGKAVGCGCNLKSGLCATCNQEKVNPPVQPPKIQNLLNVAHVNKDGLP